MANWTQWMDQYRNANPSADADARKQALIAAAAGTDMSSPQGAAGNLLAQRGKTWDDVLAGSQAGQSQGQTADNIRAHRLASAIASMNAAPTPAYNSGQLASQNANVPGGGSMAPPPPASTPAPQPPGPQAASKPPVTPGATTSGQIPQPSQGSLAGQSQGPPAGWTDYLAQLQKQLQAANGQNVQGAVGSFIGQTPPLSPGGTVQNALGMVQNALGGQLGYGNGPLPGYTGPVAPPGTAPGIDTYIPGRGPNMADQLQQYFGPGVDNYIRSGSAGGAIGPALTSFQGQLGNVASANGMIRRGLGGLY